MLPEPQPNLFLLILFSSAAAAGIGILSAAGNLRSRFREMRGIWMWTGIAVCAGVLLVALNPSGWVVGVFWAVGVGLFLAATMWALRQNWAEAGEQRAELKRIQSLDRERKNLMDGIGLVRENLELREALRASKRQSLRTQMNPHFLFNVLTGVQHLLIQGDQERATEIFRRFRQLLTQGINAGERTVGAMQEEIDHVRCYIELEAYRIRHPIDWRFEIDETIRTDSTPCPLFLLQPVVENAIWHGLRGGRVESPTLLLEMRWDQGDLVLTVSDNGVGLNAEIEEDEDLGEWESGRKKERYKRDEKFESRGMAILKERLALLRHPGSFELTECPPDHKFKTGVRATIRLPLWGVESLEDWQAKETALSAALQEPKTSDEMTAFERASEDAKAWALEVENRMKAGLQARAETP